MKVLGWSSRSESARDDAEPSDHLNNDELYAPRTQDRRIAKRKELPQLVAYYFDGGSSTPHGVRDISSNGLYIVTDVRWYPGTQVMVALQRPDIAAGGPHRSITVHAKVVRYGIDGLGLKFVMPEKHNSSNGGAYSRKAESFGRQSASPIGPREADRAAFLSFLQELPRNRDQG
jgi:hypothetical protein